MVLHEVEEQTILLHAGDCVLHAGGPSNGHTGHFRADFCRNR